MKLIICLFIVGFLCEVNSASRLCGPSLVQVLEAVCVNGFNGKIISKKSNIKALAPRSSDLFNMFNEIDDNEPPMPDSLLRDMLYSEHFDTLAKTRRQRHFTGVYDECCRKECTMDELVGYCL
ncbi:insulin-like peptide 3 [Haematobia irritans]|uniref:insulin-like peptide 3 n=1 Tax=Haematobia irritans TaxID=7368 RepID=UPI003F503CBD